MSKSFLWKALALLALVFPAVQADVSGTKTLSANQTLNLDAGTTATSGGDLLWTGSAIQFQGAAKGFDLGTAVPFGSVTQGILTAAAAAFSGSAITPVANDVIAVKTNGGNYAKVLVTAISGGSVTLQFVTFGASSSGGGPTVSAIINNYSGLLPGLPNYGIAPGSIFVIYGTGMSDNVPLQLQSSVGGLPTTLNHATISVTVGGKTVTPAIYYAVPTQIAAVLPSTTPAGTGTITVTFNGQASNAAPIQVTASAFGMGTLNQAGTGGIIATDYPNYNLITPTHSAAPGQVLILWGSGLGADTKNDDRTFPNQQDDLRGAIGATVYIGGQKADVAYAGRSQFPGVDQLNITVPQGVSGCAVGVAVVAGGKVSNFGTLPINAGNGVCVDSLYGINGTQLTQAGGQGTVKFGFIGLSQSTTPSLNGSVVRNRFGRPMAQSFKTSYDAFADFTSETSGSFSGSSDFLSLGSCLVTITRGSGGGSTGTTKGLDAGSITLTGGGLNLQLTTTPILPGLYGSQLTSLMGSTAYTFTGAGGADVGAFSSTITFPNPLTWTNESSISAVTEASGQLITWSGGATGTYVYISGGSSSADGSVFAGFTCYAPVSDQQFTVPSYVLLALPTGSGDLGVYNATNPQTFTATGLDAAFADAVVSSTENVTYQ